MTAQKIKFKPAKSTLVLGLIVAILFLVFGIFFFYLLSQEPEAYIGQVFLTIWMLVVLAIIIYFIYHLKNYDKFKGFGNILMFKDYSNSELSFEEKLVKLESLKKQGLISAEEYEIKRKEILDQKW